MSARERREIALAVAHVCGYHNDVKHYERLKAESRVRSGKLAKAYAEGQRAKARGDACSCFDCERARSRPEN